MAQSDLLRAAEIALRNEENLNRWRAKFDRLLEEALRRAANGISSPEDEKIIKMSLRRSSA